MKNIFVIAFLLVIALPARTATWYVAPTGNDNHPGTLASPFQTLPAAFGGGDPDTPPRHLGQCTGWDFEGNGVKEYFPQFYGRGEANTQPSTPHNPTGKKSF